jgi:hypothetical protein
VKKRLEALSEDFDLRRIQPIDCFEIGDRPSAATWLSQRHTGENKGRGIVSWSGVATARFRGRDPALQALDFVLEHGSLSDEEKEVVEDYFPISTLDRLLSTPAVRNQIAVEITESKLMTDLPATEIIKPLRRMVLDLATEEVTVTQLKIRDQMVAYTSSLGKDLPNLSKRTGQNAASGGAAGRRSKTSTETKAETETEAACPEGAHSPRLLSDRLKLRIPVKVIGHSGRR